MDRKNQYTKIILAVVGVVIVLWYVSSRKGSDGGFASNENLLENREGNQQQEALALANGLYLEVLQGGENVRTDLDVLRQLHASWNNDIWALLENDDGRFIAAERADTVAFNAHFITMRPITDSEFDSLSKRLDTLLSPIQSIVDSGSVAGTPNPELAQRIASLGLEIREISKPYDQAISGINAIASAAKTRGIRSETTLKSELDKIAQEEAMARAEIISSAMAKADKEISHKLASANESLLRAKGAREEQALRAEEARVLADAELDALKAQASNPDTLRRLEPFTIKTTTELICNGGSYKFLTGKTQATPISFGAISRHGALEPTEIGMKRLQNIATDSRNDRPTWPKASTPKDWEWVKENQLLLKELGPTLVELGHLMP